MEAKGNFAFERWSVHGVSDACIGQRFSSFSSHGNGTLEFIDFSFR